MRYANAGVREPHNKSKKMLKAGLQHPENVVFYSTEGFSGVQVGKASEMEPGADVSISVVGPNPYLKRDWYAQVTRDADGTFRVDGKKIPAAPQPEAATA